MQILQLQKNVVDEDIATLYTTLTEWSAQSPSAEHMTPTTVAAIAKAFTNKQDYLGADENYLILVTSMYT